MKKFFNAAIWRDTYRTIKKSIVRFLSIIVMTALAAMVFIGLQSGAPNLKDITIQRAEDHNMHDLRIQSYLGLRDKDKAMIESISDVKKVEYQNTMTFDLADSKYTIKLYTLPEEIDSPIVLEGRLPKNKSEIFLDYQYFKEYGNQIGQEISFINKQDEEDQDLLTNTNFTIVGFGYGIDYMGNTRGSSGSTEGHFFAYVSPEALVKKHPDQAMLILNKQQNEGIETEAFKREETQIVDQAIAKFKDRPDQLEAELTKEIRDAIDEGQQEIADAKKEISDAKQELEDAKVELDDAKKELADAQVELADAKKELDNGKKELDDGLVELKDGEKKYADNKALFDQEIADGWKQIQEGQSELDKAKDKLDQGQKDYEQGLLTFNNEMSSGQKELDQAKKELDQAKKELDQAKQQITDGQAQIDAGQEEINKNQTEINKNRQAIDAGLKEIEKQEGPLVEQKTDLEQQKKALVGQKDQLLVQLDQVNTAIQTIDDQVPAGMNLDILMQNLQEIQSALDNLETQVSNLTQQIKDLKIKLESASPEEKLLLENQLQILEETKEGLSSQIKEAELKKSQIETLIGALNQRQELIKSREQIQAGIGEIDKGLEQIESGLTQLKAGLEQIDQAKSPLLEGLKEIEAGQAKLDAGQEELNKRQAQLNQGQKDYREGLAKYEQGLSDYQAGLASYKQGQTEGKQALEKALKEIEAGQKEINHGQKELDQAEKTLISEQEKGQKQLDEAKEKLGQAKQDYQQGLADYEEGLADYRQGRADFEEGQKEYKEGLADYQEGLAEFETESKKANKEISDAEEKLSDADKELLRLRVPSYQIEGKYGNMMLYSMLDQADSLNNMAYIFTALFYLIAILVTLTTVLRMIETERIQMGTMKALGYSRYQIMMKYMMYGLTAALIGSLLGVIVGFYILMPPIINAYTAASNLSLTDPKIQINKAIIISLVTLTVVGLTVYITVRNSLKENAASLMRPKVPKEAKRNIFERIPALWGRLSFLNKVSIRNALRSKLRMIMTIIGIAGSFGLISMALGIKGSVENVASKQFDDIYQYDAQVIFDDLADDFEPFEKDLLEQTSNAMKLISQQGNIRTNEGFLEKINLIATNDDTKLNDFIVLRRRGHERDPDLYKLEDNKVIITEKMSMTLGLSPGDDVNFTDGKGLKHKLEVSAITEQYFTHAIYMTENTYLSTIDAYQSQNTYLIKLNDNSEENTSILERHFANYDANLSFVLGSSLRNTMQDLSDSLDVVILLIIGLSAILTFVVLSNLTNINISERLREISSIKVLGFRPNEVLSYIFKENYILTAVGIFFGYFVARFVHRTIIFTLSPESILFDPSMQWSNHLIATIVIIVFTILVMFMAKKDIDKIDMVEALKATE